MENFNRENSEIFSFEIDENAKSSFLTMARWTKFLAVLGFVMLGLFLVLGIFLSLFISSFSEAYGGPTATAIANLGPAASVIIIIVFIIGISIYLYPAYALYKYSTCIKAALATENKEQFNLAINYLKSMFKYIGICMIVLLAIYGLDIIIVALGVTGK